MHVPVILQRHIESVVSPDRAQSRFCNPHPVLKRCSGWTLNLTYISGINGPEKRILQYRGKLRKSNEKGKIQFLRHILQINSHTVRPGGLSDLFIIHFDFDIDFRYILGPLVKMFYRAPCALPNFAN